MSPFQTRHFALLGGRACRRFGSDVTGADQLDRAGAPHRHTPGPMLVLSFLNGDGAAI